MLRFLTAGESHGPSLTAILDGIPAGLKLSASIIDHELARRQKGYGSGGRNAFRAYEVLDVGGVILNDFPTFRIDHMPYGGVKESGFGREGLRYAIEEMTEPKLLVLRPGV